jgi:heme/copper-type cytochrome/quinol oxidase subunit 4
MKKMASFALVSLLTTVLFGWMLTYAFPTAADRHAIVVSAIIAYVVQMIAFAIARGWAATNVVAGWGLGMLIRFVVLALYALVGVKVLGLATTSALVSLAAFFFASTLAEPVLLKS